MRTAVLKDNEVERELASRFVCAWKNIDGEPTCGGSYGHEPGDKPGTCMPGDGEHNTQICIFTTDGRLLDAMAGYQTPKDLAAELQWAWLQARPVALDARLTDAQKQEKLSKMFEHRVGSTRYPGTRLDLQYMQKHVLDPWDKFNVEELVGGRGFGDHFFGRFTKEMPDGGLGHVPGGQQAVIDEQRRQQITEEARRLKAQYALAGDRRRAEIKADLQALEEEYEALKARNAEAAEQVKRIVAKK